MWEVEREHFAEAMAQASPLEAQALGGLIGTTFIRNGEFRAALAQFEESLETARGRVDAGAESRAFYNLGATRLRLGEFEVAEQLFEEARRLARSIPDEECLAFAECGLAAVYRVGERAPEAAELKDHALKLARHA
jgi:tetratricopeptide (TPR) repeat protein